MAHFLTWVAGGFGGAPFDDNRIVPYFSYPTILAVQVNSGSAIDRLRVHYAATREMDERWVRHGQSNGGHPYPPFTLDAAHGERLVNVHGYIGEFDDTTEVVGLRFTTNRNRVSRLYGRATLNPFNFQAPPNGRIYAFFGRSGLRLDALGARMLDF